MAHPIIRPQISAPTPHVTLHTPSGGPQNPTRQGRAPDPTANHSISTVIAPSSTAARRSFHCVNPSTWSVIIKAAANRTATTTYAMPGGRALGGSPPRPAGLRGVLSLRTGPPLL